MQGGQNHKREQETNKNGIGFAVLLFLYQVMICLFYGFWFRYSQGTPSLQNGYDQTSIFLIALLSILVIVGFGLVNSYITNASFSGMGMTLLIFILSLEHYFLIRAFWEKAGATDVDNIRRWSNPITEKISFVNLGQDRSVTSLYPTYSFVDAIACALANVVAFSSVVGRIKLLEVFFLTLLGTFLYEVNSQIFYKYSIYDSGYGMRIFLFGSCLGLISCIVLGKKELTFNHPRYISNYNSRGLSLFGLLVQICTFPCLIASSLYAASVNKNYILESSVLRMYLALVAGVLGSFCASALRYRKIMIHDLIFGGIAGGIAYSSSADLHENPAVPLTIGFAFGLICSIHNSKSLRHFNDKGVSSSLASYFTYLVPGLFSGIFSSILAAIGQADDSPYVYNRSFNLKPQDQAGYQMAGVAICIAFGVGAGLLIGLLYRLINNNERDHQFNDYEIYRSDLTLKKQLVSYRET